MRAIRILLAVLVCWTWNARLVGFQPPPKAIFGARDMLAIARLVRGQVALSPDGKHLAYVLPDRDDPWNVLARRPRGRIFLQELDPSGRPPKALTPKGGMSSHPVWSPHGRRLAFFEEQEGRWWLAVLDRKTGEGRRLGAPFLGRPYLAPAWDPTGEFLVYAPALAPPPKKPPERVTVLESSDRFLPGDKVFWDQRQARLMLAEVARGKITPLVGKPLRLRSFSLSPGGGQLYYQAASAGPGRGVPVRMLLGLGNGARARPLQARGRLMGWLPGGKGLLYLERGRLVARSLDGGEESALFSPGLKVGTSPRWSPDGQRFASLVPDRSLKDPEVEPPRPGMYSIARPFFDLYLVSPKEGVSKNLSAGFEDQVSQPLWSPDGRRLFFKATNNQTYDESIYRYDLREQKLHLLARGEKSFRLLQASPKGLLVSIQDATAPPDLWLLDGGTGALRRLTRLNPQLERFHFSKPRLFHFWNADGERLGALLYRPVGVAPDAKVGVITYVYEKLTPGIHRFQPRQQIFLNHGFAVLMPNVKVKVGETGTSFVKAVVPAVNATRAMGFSNGRFALWGGSFGAYAASYVITQTDIFACAACRATPPELFRNWASGRDRDSDNIERGQARMGGSPFEVMGRYLSQSAFFHLDHVQTPVLIMHGVMDHTILFGEGAMMFYALRRLGRKATFVIYAHGDHSLSRHSRTDTLDVYRRLLAWFQRYLK